MNKDLPPSQKADARKELEEKNRAKLQAQHEDLQKSMRIVFASPDGQVVLKWLRDQCHHNQPILGVNPATQEIDPNRTLYQVMRMNLYLQIRKFLTFDILKEVEYEPD